jgi:Ca2+-binding EF-hand superfamily protein
VIKLVIGLANMGGVEAEREVLLACVQDILEAIDVDRDGDITREEFVNNAMKSSFIRNMLGEN